MLYCRLFLALLAPIVRLEAQLIVYVPEVNTASFVITDTVYMAPNGDDGNPGTYNKPVRSFTKALELLPFKGPGLPAYGLVRLHPGVYYTSSGFQQSEGEWRNSSGATKNVSVEGIDDVVIQGPADNDFAIGHLLHLRGSHIFVRNIRFKYGNLNGVFIQNDPYRVSDVIIENVEVDSVGNFGMLLERADRIEVRYSAARYSARPGEEQLPPQCQWPSGIKFLGCTHATIHHCEVAYTRGEGLNFHNTLYGRAYRNILHDNPLQFYCDNSARLLVYQNYLYNNSALGTRYWLTCPKDTTVEWSGSAFLLANEGACIRGNLPRYEGCTTRCSSPDEAFSNVDSVYIFNNFVQKVGRFIDLWQGNLSVWGENCLRNVFFWHNTFVEIMGKPNPKQKGAAVNVYFPDKGVLSFSGLRNVRIAHNLFAFHPDSIAPLAESVHPGIPKDYRLERNLWSRMPISPHVSPDNIERFSMPFRLSLLGDTSLHRIVPYGDTIISNAAFLWMTPALSKMPPYDYFDLPRRSDSTNVGAFEYRTVSTRLPAGIERVRVYPVPAVDWIQIDLLPQYMGESFTVDVYDVSGRLLEVVHNRTRLSCSHWPPGFYRLTLRGSDRIFYAQAVKAP